MPPFRHRHRAALLAVGLIVGGPLLAVSPASAEPVESGRQGRATPREDRHRDGAGRDATAPRDPGGDTAEPPCAGAGDEDAQDAPALGGGSADTSPAPDAAPLDSAGNGENPDGGGVTDGGAGMAAEPMARSSR